MNTADQLTQVFYDNFVAYFRSHVAHVNILGRNFFSDHKLLEKIYDDLQDQIDTIAELLRSLDAFMPNDIQEVLLQSQIPVSAFEEDSDGFLDGVKTDLETLKSDYEYLMTVADGEGHEEIANYAQDRILSLSKQIWMLGATLS
jgi:starvation-inducible DNA-binding protein